MNTKFGTVINYAEIYFTFIHPFINIKISGCYTQQLNTYLPYKICVVIYSMNKLGVSYLSRQYNSIKEKNMITEDMP
jgi:hypothetical protein